MWKQLDVVNSFTLEATFAGSTLKRYVPHHFHCGDFMSVGQSFAESVLEYWNCLSNPQITRHYANLIEHLICSNDCSMPGLSNFGLDCTLARLLTASQTDSLAVSLNNAESLVDIIDVLEKLEFQWKKQCESSSDSDSCSGSEVEEIPNVMERQRRNKRLKKMRKKDKKLEKKALKRGRLVNGAVAGGSEAVKEDRDCLPELDMRRVHIRQMVRPTKCAVTVKSYKFVNPYANRSNGGIPMFSQERIEERAKKVGQSISTTTNLQIPIQYLHSPNRKWKKKRKEQSERPSYWKHLSHSLCSPFHMDTLSNQPVYQPQTNCNLTVKMLSIRHC
jgi:hypothetical protein